VLPREVLAMPTPMQADAQRALIARSAEALGIATADDLRDYYRLGPAQSQQAVAVRKEVANEIVTQLQSMGLRAIRSDIPAPADQNVLIVEGHFDTIDSGNRRRRTLIGMGAGESRVTTSVQLLYKPAGGVPRLVQSFDATGDSGKMPGVAETAGVGAVAGHVAVSAAAGGGLHAVSESKHDVVSSDAKRLADSIAKQVAEIGVSEGWMSSGRIKG